MTQLILLFREEDEANQLLLDVGLSSPVMKSTAGKHFHLELSRQVRHGVHYFSPFSFSSFCCHFPSQKIAFECSFRHFFLFFCSLCSNLFLLIFSAERFFVSAFVPKARYSPFDGHLLHLQPRTRHFAYFAGRSPPCLCGCPQDISLIFLETFISIKDIGD